MIEVENSEAELLLKSGKAKPGMKVSGFVDLKGTQDLYSLPEDFTVEALNLEQCRNLRSLPRGLKARRLILTGCVSLKTLPDDLVCNELVMPLCHFKSWPDKVTVKQRLDLSNSDVETLPAGLKVGNLNLRGCLEITELPEKLNVYFLNIAGCKNLAKFPARGSVQFGRLIARDCTLLTELPDWLTRVGQLDLAGCSGITKLPKDLEIGSWIDIAGTGITSLPDGVDEKLLRWRGVSVDTRIAFRPETITSQEILDEKNVERRRVLLERMGYEKFLKDAKAQTLDSDTDAGGIRRLLKVDMQDDEDLVVVAVICPSTDRQFIIRVPPAMTTCRQAVAWIAGFEKEEDYVLLKET